MAVYVDDMQAPLGRMKMCHMLADTDAELHAMADRIGVNRQWWQSPEHCSGSHYDITLSKRALAVAAGAVEITMRQAGCMNRRRRLTGELGRPEDAIAWVRTQMGDARQTQILGRPEPLRFVASDVTFDPRNCRENTKHDLRTEA